MNLRATSCVLGCLPRLGDFFVLISISGWTPRVFSFADGGGGGGGGGGGEMVHCVWPLSLPDPGSQTRRDGGHLGFPISLSHESTNSANLPGQH